MPVNDLLFCCFDTTKVIELGGEYYHHPPQLDMIIQICKSISSWLKSDKENIAVVHCGDELWWSVLVVACFLADSKKVSNAQDAIQTVYDVLPGATAPCKAQARYANYFDLHLHRPSGSISCPAVLLQRVVISMHPLVGKVFTAATLPSVQLFAGGRLVLSTSWQHLMAFSPEEGFVTIALDTEVVGDVVLDLCVTVRGYSTVHVCSYAFHTAFTSPSAVHLNASQLDGQAVESWL